MKKHNRILAFMLAMLTASSLLFTACANNDKQSDKGSQNPDSGSDVSSDGNEEDNRDIYELAADFDFEGRDFRVVYIDYGSTLNTTFDFDAPSSDKVNKIDDALYNRNRRIEDKYGINFVQESHSYDTNPTLLETTVNADEYAFDMIMLVNRHAYTAALNRYIVSVDQLPYVDITKDYYMQDVNDQISILGKHYIVYSAEQLNLFEQTMGMFFNKKLAEKYNIGDIYSMVNDGTWTMDKMFAMMQNTDDLNGNSRMENTDQWGVVGNTDFVVPALWIGADTKTVEKDSDDYPVFTAGNNEKFLTVLKYVIDSFNENKIWYRNADYSDSYQKMFMNDLSLFYMHCVNTIFSIKDMDSEYGLLPIPKYDENQEKYCSSIVDGWPYVVPVTNRDLEGTSIIIETLAYETEENVMPSYYDISLKYRYLRDQESIEMLDLIRSTLVFDLGTVTWAATIRNMLTQKKVVNDSSNITSTIAANESDIESLIENAIDLYNSIG